MRNLYFNVDGQAIRQQAEFEGLVPGTSGYLQAVFAFSQEWIGCTKVVSFLANGQEHAVLLKGNSCIIPKEVLTEKYFRVQVIGKVGEYCITTNKAKVKQGGVS